MLSSSSSSGHITHPSLHPSTHPSIHPSIHLTDLIVVREVPGREVHLVHHEGAHRDDVLHLLVQLLVSRVVRARSVREGRHTHDKAAAHIKKEGAIHLLITDLDRLRHLLRLHAPRRAPQNLGRPPRALGAGVTTNDGREQRSVSQWAHRGKKRKRADGRAIITRLA